jgi:uncharacterized protein with HEPN domain
MSRDLDSLRDMILAARRVLRYVENISQKDFAEDLEKQDSIIYKILVLGEASKRLLYIDRLKNPAYGTIVPYCN